MFGLGSEGGWGGGLLRERRSKLEVKWFSGIEGDSVGREGGGEEGSKEERKQERDRDRYGLATERDAHMFCWK